MVIIYSCKILLFFIIVLTFFMRNVYTREISDELHIERNERSYGKLGEKRIHTYINVTNLRLHRRRENAAELLFVEVGLVLIGSWK